MVRAPRLSLAIALTAALVSVASSAGAKKPPKADAPDFDKQAAVAALSSVDLSKCKPDGATKGDGHVFVTYKPGGSAMEASVDRGPMVGSKAQKCIEKEFKKTKVPAFKGGNVQVGKSFKFE